MKGRKNSPNPDIGREDGRPSERIPRLASLPAWVYFLFSAGCVFFIYSNTFQAPFVFDDIRNIQENTYIRLTDISIAGLCDAALKSPCSNRPVANVSFALNYYFHQYNLSGYHFVNTIIHVLTGVFLFFLVRLTLSVAQKQPSSRLLSEKSNPDHLAFFATLLWLVHPLHTQSVTYVVQRMTSMAGMFYVLSLLCYAQGRVLCGARRWALYAGSLLSGLLAFGSKEISATLPVFIFLYEWYFFQNLDSAWLRKKLPLILAPALVIATLAFFYLGFDPLERILRGYAGREFTLPQRVMTEFRVVFLYLGLIFFPHPGRLNLDHDVSLSLSLIDPPATLLSLLVILGLLGYAVYTAKRDALVSFAILWFFGNLVIESSVIGLELVFEHRTYLPSMLVVVAAVAAVRRHVRMRWASVGLLCAAVALSAVWTCQRNEVWTDNLTLWQDAARKSPQKARPLFNLGTAFLDRDMVDQSVEYLQKALDIDTRHWCALNNMGLISADQGRIAEAIDYFSRAVHAKQDYIEARINLAFQLARAGRIPEAVGHYRKVVDLDPSRAEVYSNLGIHLFQLDELDEALFYLSKAVELRPGDAEAHYNLGTALVLCGDSMSAAKQYEKAVELAPDYVNALYSLGVVLAELGRISEAIHLFKKVLALDPGHEQARYNLKIAMAQKTAGDKDIEKVQVKVR